MGKTIFSIYTQGRPEYPWPEEAWVVSLEVPVGTKGRNRRVAAALAAGLAGLCVSDARREHGGGEDCRRGC